MMKKEKTYVVRLTELEMNTIFVAIEKTLFAGEYSEAVTAIKDKMHLEEPPI